MKLSYRWLSELVDLEGVDPARVQDLLTFHTAEVEERVTVGEELSGVVSASVTAIRPHPDADKLRLCTVDPGEGAEPVEVVCGAPNVAEGQVIAYAPVGTTLPGGGEGPIKLKRRKIRGVESSGMICSEQELGLGDSHDGILVLPAETPIGRPLPLLLQLTDTIFDIANVCITHRPDLWGHVGFARELGALLSRPPTWPAVESEEALPSEGTPFPVRVEDEAGCPRYVGIVIDNLRNGPSPLALRRRLESLGMRSIDLLVDLTNYVLLEQGQPLHAFDLRDIRGGEIRVRRAVEGERIKTLDDQERRLTTDDLVIADAEGALAIAGVMGGEHSEVRADTTSILLEAANFDAVRVRRTATRLGLRTEASSRFEKSLDPELPWQAALRFVALLRHYVPEVAVRLPATDCYAARPEPRELVLPYALVRRRLGRKVPDLKIRAVLTALGFKPVELGDSTCVRVPSWRAGKDITRPEDLVEEVGRIYGYRKLIPMAPIAPVAPRRPRPMRAFERRVGATLSLELGYAEVKHRSFYGAREAAWIGLEDAVHLRVRNPSSEDHDRMILTTAPHMLATVATNLHHAGSGRVWETARVFVPCDAGLPVETQVLALATWDREGADTPAGGQFLSLVGDIRALCERVGIAREGEGALEIENSTVGPLAEGLPPPAWLHPGRRATLRAGGHLLGSVGEVVPGIVRTAGLEGRCCVAELNLSQMREAAAQRGSRYEPVLRYPVVPFDVAVVVPRRTPAGDVQKVIAEAAPGSVRSLHVFDVYEGAPIPAGQRSIALRCELFDRDRTLTAKAADKLRARVIRSVEGAGWSVRTDA